MSLFSVFRRPLLAILPALLVASACSSKKDEPAPTPAPDQGRIKFHHMAASANVSLKFLAYDAEKASLTYGQSTNYQSVLTGSPTIKVNVASTGNTALNKSLTVAKDKNYSYFAYAADATSLADLLITDDLTAPTSGKAKIRLVHLGQGSATPLKLSTTVAAVSDIPNTETAFGAASSFVEILPGAYNVAVTSGAASTTITNGNVGDGSGSGTAANRTYEAGKIYTVVVRGITGPLVDASLQPKVILIQNN